MKHSILINTDDIVELKYVGGITKEAAKDLIEMAGKERQAKIFSSREEAAA